MERNVDGRLLNIPPARFLVIETKHVAAVFQGGDDNTGMTIPRVAYLFGTSKLCQLANRTLAQVLQLGLA